MRGNVKKLGFVGCMAMAVWGCGGSSGGALGPAQVAEQVNDKLPPLVDDSATTFACVGDTDAWAAFWGAFESSDASTQLRGLPVSLPFGRADLERTRALLSHGPDGTNTEGEELAAFLTEEVFTDANYEGDGVYRLPASAVCPTTDTGQLDPGCVADLNAAEIRLRATGGDGMLVVDVLVGPARDELFSIEATADSIAAVVDLAEAKAAATHLANVAGSETNLPETFQGVLAAKLTRNSPTDARFDLSVRQAVAIGGTFASGKPYAFSTAAKDPLLSFHATSPCRLVAALDLGKTVVQLPNQEIFSDSPNAGTWTLLIGGASATTVLEQGQPTLTITNVGLGDESTTLKLDDTTVLTIDLNADAGRRFDVTFEPVTGERSIVRLSPKLDLALDFYFQALLDAGEPDVDPSNLDESYRFALDGTGAAAQPIDATYDATGQELTPEATRVVGGVLSITAGSGPSISASAGQCLLHGDPVEAGEHPLIGSFAVGACP